MYLVIPAVFWIQLLDSSVSSPMKLLTCVQERLLSLVNVVRAHPLYFACISFGSFFSNSVLSLSVVLIMDDHTSDSLSLFPRHSWVYLHLAFAMLSSFLFTILCCTYFVNVRLGSSVFCIAVYLCLKVFPCFSVSPVIVITCSSVFAIFFVCFFFFFFFFFFLFIPSPVPLSILHLQSFLCHY